MFRLQRTTPNIVLGAIVVESVSPRPNTYHVTELTGCLAKAYFSRTRQVQEMVESAWAKLRGSMLHYVVRSLGWSELKVSMRFPLKAEEITIVGHVDGYDPETATVYDLKTTRFVKWQAEKNFIPQRNPHCPSSVLCHVARQIRHPSKSHRLGIRGRPRHNPS